MLSVREVVVVEGRYDKAALASVLSSPVIELRGFGIYKDKPLLSLLRRLAVERGIVILTDSDGAGFQIRGYLKSAIPEGRVLCAYIPDIYGKEKRKSSPSAEGKLGVEAMKPQVLEDALLRAGATVDDRDGGKSCAVSKAELYKLGLSGRTDSSLKRQTLKKKLDLPERLPANQLAAVLGVLYSPDELRELCAGLFLKKDTADGTDEQ